ncbi:MAG TPA: stage III sporulation protein AD [Clostridiales bacterium]|nr:stage III sporulation protein AD [Clostridiales bacterium]
MEIFQVVGLAVVSVVVLLVIRRHRPEMAVLLALVVGLVIFFMVAQRLLAVLEFLRDLAARAGVDSLYLNIILKIVGIAYITEIGAQVCRDAQETSVAAKVELAGKLLILVLAVPIVMAIVEAVLRVL